MHKLEGYKYSLNVKSKGTTKKTQEEGKCIGNNLKTNKKWNIQGSWNGTIVLTNNKITKVICFKCYNHKTMISLTKLEGFMCT
jgi:hypothetical protein